MALKIVWTPQAVDGLDKVLGYLEKEWTNQYLKIFKNKFSYYIYAFSKNSNI